MVIDVSTSSEDGRRRKRGCLALIGLIEVFVSVLARVFVEKGQEIESRMTPSSGGIVAVSIRLSKNTLEEPI